MNHDDPRHRSPPRADPLQPDKPDQGSGKDGTAVASRRRRANRGGTHEGAEKLSQQSENALENVREGYGRL